MGSLHTRIYGCCFFQKLTIVYHISFCRENRSIERHADAMVSLLETCLQFNLKPTFRDEDPPHAKIASEILSCIFMVRAS